MRFLAQEIGFDSAAVQMIRTAVSELARNIVKYAESGVITVKAITESDRSGIEVLCSDRGPGIENIARALDDHFSSSGTLGLGLPGVKRMMDEFEIQSTPGTGTDVTIRKWL